MNNNEMESTQSVPVRRKRLSMQPKPTAVVEPTTPVRAEKKQKPYLVMYRAKDAGKHAANPLLSSFTTWKILSEHSKLDFAQGEVNARKTGNALMQSFEYKIVDRDGKEH